MASIVERIRRDVSLVEIAHRFGVALQPDGEEWIACCPFHAEKTESFTIFTGRDGVERFQCFGCKEAGDVLDFVALIKGIPAEDIRQIADYIDGKTKGENIAPRRIETRDIYEGIEALDPPEELQPGRVKLYNPKRAGTETEWGSFVPSLIHPYRRQDGSLFGYVLRHDLRDGRKETPMIMWVRMPDGSERWCRFPFPRPRPLYRVETLSGRQVIVVEGEKCADALALATGRVVVSWAGGSQGAKYADWSPLAGRNVVMWPDCDPEGLKTADDIGAILTQFENPATYRTLAIPRFVAA